MKIIYSFIFLAAISLVSCGQDNNAAKDYLHKHGVNKILSISKSDTLNTPFRTLLSMSYVLSSDARDMYKKDRRNKAIEEVERLSKLFEKLKRRVLSRDYYKETYDYGDKRKAVEVEFINNRNEKEFLLLFFNRDGLTIGHSESELCKYIIECDQSLDNCREIISQTQED